jgi:peptide/nickel transport system permease protein
MKWPCAHRPRLWLHLLSRTVATAIVVYLLVFIAFAVLPLNPARALLGPVADEHAVAAVNAQFGFDAPLPERLVRVTSQLLRGNFGTSIVYGQPVGPLVGWALSITLSRLALAVALGASAALWLVPVAVARNWRPVKLALMVAAGMPSFVLLALLLTLCGSILGMAPSQARWLYESLAVAVAALATMVAVSLTLLDRLDFRSKRSRQADFLMLLHAPVDRMVALLMRSARPSAFAAAANSVAAALTALTFAEFVFGLPGFAVMFMQACDNGDIAIVTLGSLVLAGIFVLMQGIADLISARTDQRLG